MKLLAIETALEACSVAAIVGDDREPFVMSETIGRGHAERLFGMITATMDTAGLGFSELDRIAVTIGPGSFTGLRVGIAAARGLALVVGCPIVGIGTLAVHAETARKLAGAVPVLAVLDARRDEVYGQRFAADGAPIGPAEIGSASYFASMIEAGDVLAGAGADIVAEFLVGDLTIPIVHRQSAPDIGALARMSLLASAPDAAPRPLYLRPPDAKPQTTKGVARQ
jgi:tRNA threonylcarbamoyladenosine biosynthesis protein TsaB